MENQSNKTIEKIQKRIDSIIEERPSHKAVLEFLKEVMIEQRKIKPAFKTVPVRIDEEKIKGLVKGHSFVERRGLNLDTASASSLFRRLCKILSRHKEASEDAKRITQALQSEEIIFPELFNDAIAETSVYISSTSKRLKVREELLSFLAESSIKPMFEAYANELKRYVDQERWWRGYCPICGSPPFLSELREEGERFLVCSLCNFEWRFMRLKCPFCENEDHKELRYFCAKEKGKAYRVDVCEKCKRYIKTIDAREMVVEVIPAVEDMGTLYLDVIAQKEGYMRWGSTYGGLIN